MNDPLRSRTIRDWQLERHRLNELPPEEAAFVAEALGRDEGLRQRLGEIEVDSRATLAEIPARGFAAAVRARAARTQPSRGGFAQTWRPALGAAATLALAIGVVALWQPFRDPDPSSNPAAVSEGADTTRIKGLRPHVLLFRKTRDGVEALRSGSLCRRGDVVQLAYQAAGRRYGAIFSLDGRGVVTQHLPAAGTAAVLLEAGGETALPSAYQLDDAPRFEVFYLVTSPTAFELPPLLDVARHTVPLAADPAPLPPLRLPAGLEVTELVLRKDDHR